ncbi:histidine kinase [Streptomyces sp. NRRL F-4489]|uniref:CBS domain-containing protein n=1 Tax=Streptomyces sp. NRRL F-4489 TaxID=1609095 RepID=UPI0007481269|nr:CBS domain-containing protein [Streptomyces sp. NRRL F-4489]KUL38460.1 histidine kinase [Streptomyces sp. NRRL F-4489]
MTSARELMTAGADCVGADESVVLAAKRMADLGVSALPIRGGDNRIQGMLTYRDIVVNVLARERDPATTKAGELSQEELVAVDVDDDAHHVLRIMAANGVHRLPVLDGTELVGTIGRAEVARALPDPQVGELLDALSRD